jgi:hypothetical protein
VKTTSLESLLSWNPVIEFQYDDGGRRAAGFTGEARDCVCRSIAIAGRLDYAEIYKRLADGNASQRQSRRDRGPRQRSARNGVNVQRKWFKDLMAELGFEWTPTMSVGSGCRVHLRRDELPEGRLVVRVSGHLCAVVNGVLHDTYDCSRDGSRCVYGYWISRA